MGGSGGGAAETDAQTRFCHSIAGENSMWDVAENACRCKEGFEEDAEGMCVRGDGGAVQQASAVKQDDKKTSGSEGGGGGGGGAGGGGQASVNVEADQYCKVLCSDVCARCARLFVIIALAKCIWLSVSMVLAR